MGVHIKIRRQQTNLMDTKFFHRLSSHCSSPIQTITVGFGFAPNQLALTDFELLHHRRLGISPYPEGYVHLVISYDNIISIDYPPKNIFRN